MVAGSWVGGAAALARCDSYWLAMSLLGLGFVAVMWTAWRLIRATGASSAITLCAVIACEALLAALAPWSAVRYALLLVAAVHAGIIAASRIYVLPSVVVFLVGAAVADAWSVWSRHGVTRHLDESGSSLLEWITIALPPITPSHIRPTVGVIDIVFGSFLVTVAWYWRGRPLIVASAMVGAVCTVVFLPLNTVVPAVPLIALAAGLTMWPIIVGDIQRRLFVRRWRAAHVNAGSRTSGDEPIELP